MDDKLGEGLGASLGKIAANSEANLERSHDKLTKEFLRLQQDLLESRSGKGKLPNIADVPELKLTDLAMKQKLQNEISSKDIKESERLKTGFTPENTLLESYLE